MPGSVPPQGRSSLVLGLVLAASVLGGCRTAPSPAAAANAGPAPHPPALAAATRLALPGRAASLRLALAAAVQRDAPPRYALQPPPQGDGAAWLVAHNERQEMVAALDPTGRVRVEPTATGSAPPWRLGLRTSRWGRGAALVAVPSVSARRSAGNRAEYSRGAAFTEWYVNGPLGLEQGFTLAGPPDASADRARPLTLVMEVSGDLRACPVAPAAAGDGWIGFTRPGAQAREDEVVARYGALLARDARGRALPASLTVSPSQVSISIDDRGAAYPLAIDPLLSTETKLDLLGDAYEPRSVAIDGDTIVVGVAAGDAAHVLTWTGTTWVHQQALTVTGLTHVAISGDTIAVATATGVEVFVDGGGTWTPQQQLVLAGVTALDLDGDTIVAGTGAAETAYVYTRTATTWSSPQVLTDSAGAAGDLFGTAVGVSGATIAVGAPTKRAVVLFDRGASSWGQGQTLADATRIKFGGSVALDGDTLLVGAPRDSSVEGIRGSVHFFVRAGTWSLQQSLDGVDYKGQFGTAVALSGDAALVQAVVYVGPGIRTPPTVHFLRRSGDTWAIEHAEVENEGPVALDGDRAVAGAAVFVLAGAAWVPQQTLGPADTTTGAGQAVAVDGDTAVVGAERAVYVFVWKNGAWGQEGRLVGLNSMGSLPFGFAVAVDGDTIAVGGPGIDGYSGTVEVFVRKNGAWSREQNIPSPDGISSSRAFGYSVALSGDTLAIGAPGRFAQLGGFPGIVRVFLRTGTTWSPQQELTASDAYNRDSFGRAVSLDGDTLVVGGLGSDKAYVFTRAATNWTERATLPVAAGATGTMALRVALDGDTIAVGASGDDAAGPDAGKVLVYTGAGASWTLQQELTASDAAAGDAFGDAVALEGNTLIVGAPGKDDLGTSSGAVYFFRRNLTQWIERGKLHASDGAAYAAFGSTVGIAGRHVLVGAPYSAGAAYVYEVAALDDGAACATGDQCLSGRCVDQTCCTSACSETCFGCGVAGHLGTCTPRPWGEEVTGACDATNACDGTGRCAKQLGQACGADTECIPYAAAAVDLQTPANGRHCIDGACCGADACLTCYSCNLAGSEGSCAPIAMSLPDQFPAGACVDTLACDGLGNCKKNLGESCANDMECAADHCVDGVCCDAPCDGQCEQCDAVGSLGHCAPVPAGADPHLECQAAQGGHTLCAGKCNGSRQCEFPDLGTSCGLCAACDGTGRCTETPADDEACGVIDCSGLDTVCRAYQDLTAGRCLSLGTCRAANDSASCTVWTDLPCDDGGVPLADGGPAGADAGAPGNTGGGCSVAAAARPAPLLVAALSLACLVLRRRRR